MLLRRRCSRLSYNQTVMSSSVLLSMSLEVIANCCQADGMRLRGGCCGQTASEEKPAPLPWGQDGQTIQTVTPVAGDICVLRFQADGVQCAARERELHTVRRARQPHRHACRRKRWCGGAQQRACAQRRGGSTAGARPLPGALWDSHQLATVAPAAQSKTNA